ncbi:DUF7619 domain-containing protein [Psychroserpens mesophilus]|uniref:DUF7619 domain-containing protein n=1 Tax=Psychroserpens mesophilus TaxID=325473 RepID=UPI003D646091
MKSFLFSVLFTMIFLFGNAQIVDIPDGWFEYALLNTSCADIDGDGVPDSNVDTNNDGFIQISEAESVIGLFLDENEAITLDGLQYFINLRYFEGYFPELETLNLTPHINLEELQIYNCFVLNDLNIDGLTNLKTLTIYGAYELNDLDLTGFVNLENLTCYNLREVTSLNFSNLVSLLNLTVFDVPAITSLNFYGLTNLESIEIYGYNDVLVNIDLNGLISLDDLTINFIGGLSNLNLSGLINLEYMNLDDCTGLSSLDLTDLINLKYVHLRNCSALSSIDMAGLANLLYLDTSYGSSLSNLDVSELESLSTFYAFNSNFSSLDLSQNSNLETLGVGNSINLQYLNIKNGITGSANINNCINLEFICVDDIELETIQYLVDFYDIANCEVNTYCSFIPGGEVYYVEGQNKIDVNLDGCDSNDAVYPNMNFSISNGIDSGTFIADVTGNYSLPVSEGSFILTPNVENLDYFTISPNTLSVNFPSDISPYNQDFCLTSNGAHNDLEVVIIPITNAIPGFESYYRIIYRNKGNTILSGNIEFDYHLNSDYIENVLSSPTYDTDTNNTMSWDFTDLAPFETREIEVVFNLNTPVDPDFPLNSGDDLGYVAQIFPLIDDETTNDNRFELKQDVVNSLDPNDITCLEGESILPEDVGKYVHYMIRFENLGTANATNIVVKNAIDATKFDVNTLVPLDGSHDYVTRINSDNDVEFIFENIQLPFDDANNDGYIVYKIKTLESLVLGDVFSNQAEIYFDFNAPIITNNYTTEVEEDTFSVDDFNFSTIKIYPNPVIDILNIESNLTIQTIRVFDIQGRKVLEVAQDNINLVDMSTLNSGIYFVKVFSNSKTETIKVVKH